MSMRKHGSRIRAWRPQAESLETRQLLSGVVNGTDIDGDQFSLRLLGPGSIRVIKQNDSTGSPGSLDSRTSIRTIEIAGTDPLQTRLVGSINRVTGGDGKVFFQQINVIQNIPAGVSAGQGIKSIDLPEFWLGVTDPSPGTTPTNPVASITVPNGVNSLRFGGVDATAFFGTDQSQAPSNNGQSDQFLISLGLNQEGGTRIIVDKMISNSQPGTTNSSGTTAAPTQDSVIVQVEGRISLFQANSIEGNTTNPPTQGSLIGGTVIGSTPNSAQTVTGQIGFVRIGGNATNFQAFTNDRISNFYVGGETNNVTIVAPSAVRNLFFGKGLDTTQINAGRIFSLQANRGALNSTVLADTKLDHMRIGGDVSNSTFRSGLNQGLLSAVSTFSQSFGSTFQSALNLPTETTSSNGRLSGIVAGSVTNSVFVASVDPNADGEYGTSDALTLPGGNAAVKIEGTVDNSDVTPSTPDQAVFARNVNNPTGPVVPPNVTEAPFGKAQPVRVPGIPVVYPKTATQRVKGPFPKLPSVKATSVKTTSTAKKTASTSTDTTGS